MGLSNLDPLPCLPTYQVPGRPEVDVIIGMVKNNFGTLSLVFLSRSGWICSVDLEITTAGDMFRRHFFIPQAWLSRGTKLIARVTEKKDIVFACGEELAVVQNGLENVEVTFLR